MPQNPAPEKDAFQILAENLQYEAVPENILAHLESLFAGLDDPLVSDHKAMTFLQAGGLPSLIRCLRGAATLGSMIPCDTMSSTIAHTAAEVLCRLLNHCGRSVAEVSFATGGIAPLIDALRDAPTCFGRCVGAYALCAIAKAYPAQHVAIAEAGVVGMVVALYPMQATLRSEGMDGLHIEEVQGPAVELVHMLMCSGTVALRDLRHAIVGQNDVQAYDAFLLLQVCQSKPTHCWGSAY